MYSPNKEKHPNFHDAYNYATEVVTGKQPNCIYIIAACKNFLRDFHECISNPTSTYIFDIDYVERYLRLVQKFEHVIGVWDTPNIEYVGWQKWFWSAALGFRHRDNPRRPKHKYIYLEAARGSAKSTMASQNALYFLGLDTYRAGEKLATFATKSDQSRIILDAARAMANKAHEYIEATGVEVLAHKIVDHKSFSEMVAMSSDSKSMDGLNLKIAYLDELHAMARALYEVVTSGMRKRIDSLVICLTTAGFNTNGVGYEQSSYAKKVVTGLVKDDSLFAAIYTIDEGDDIYNEVSWRKANPGYGVSVDPVAFKSAAEKARVTPSEVTNFKVKSLNIWTSEAKAFFDVSAWNRNAIHNLKIEDFYGKRCIAAVDLASKVDLAAIGLLFKEDDGTYYFFDKSYIPEQTYLTANSTVYDNAVSSGELIVTPGEAIDIDTIQRDFIEIAGNHNLGSGLFDPWNAVQFGQNMTKIGIEMKEFRMSTANLSEATKTLDALIRSGKFKHSGSSLLSWCISNVVCKEDAAGNVFPKKETEKNKIDPALTAIICLAGWLQETQEESAYEDRGVLFLN